MISVATLDPSTLALWFNPTYVTDHINAKVLEKTLHLSLSDKLDSYKSYYSSLSSIEKPFSANIASAIWHEKRHFQDLLLTNYGTYRVRQFFLIASNSFAILKKMDKRIAFPFEVYADPVRRRIAGIPQIDSSLEQILSEIKFRKRVFSLEAGVKNINGYKCEMGGDAQLEALAFTFQIGANQQWLGVDGAKQWQLGLENAFQNPRYRWAELIASHYGLLPTSHVDDKINVIDCTLLICILYASLMMRSWGQTYEHKDLGTISLLTPYIRFRMLLDDLEGKGFELGTLSISNAWALVNERCKKLFGKTAIEELETDYELECNWVRKLDINDNASAAFSDFNNLRGKVIEIFKTSPEYVLDIGAWSKIVLPQLQPLVVFANPSGVEGTSPPDMPVILEQSASNKKWWWAALLRTPKTNLSFTRTESWIFVLKYLAPLAKLILSGRRHQIMIGPELLLIEHELERLGFTLYFDESFEFPDDENDTYDYYRLTSRTKFNCDFCRDSIPHGKGQLLGPWKIRKNYRLANVCIAGLGGGDRGLLELWKDWSHWHFCETCLESLKANGILESD